MHPYPWWTLYLEPPFFVGFMIVHLITWFKWDMMKYDETSRVLMRCVFMTFDFVNLTLYKNMPKKQQKCVKRIPPPNASIPLVDPILRTSLLCRIHDYPRDYLIQMRHDEIWWDLKETWWTWCIVFSWLLTFANIILQKKHQTCVKRIPPPNASIPLVDPILRTSLFCRILWLSTWLPDSNETWWNMMWRQESWCVVFYIMTFDVCKYNSTKKISINV